MCILGFVEKIGQNAILNVQNFDNLIGWMLETL